MPFTPGKKILDPIPLTIPQSIAIHRSALKSRPPVPQFHLHVVARWVGDPVWPGPVWGHDAARPYDDVDTRGLIAAAKKELRL